MPNKKREMALRLLEDSDPELAKTFREELKKRKNEIEDNKDFKTRVARYKPKLQYTRLSDPVLLYFWALLEQRITGCIADAVARYFNPSASFLPGKLKSDVSMVRKWPLSVLINEFHGAGVDEKQTFQLVKLVLERAALLVEYEKRMASRIIGRELRERQPEVGRLLRLLRVDKIKSYRPEQGPEDLHQNALTWAYEAYEKQCNTLAETPTKTIPRFPLKDGVSWDFIHAARWETEIKPSLRRVLPILYGTSEEIPETVRQVQRNEWKTIARRKRIFNGTDEFPTKGPDAWRAVWDLSERTAAERRAVIRGETTGKTLEMENPEEIVIEKETRREELKETMKSTTRAYEIAAKRSGPKGVVYINELKAGRTEKEAAVRANISDRTGRRILEAIREAHPKTRSKTHR